VHASFFVAFLASKLFNTHIFWHAIVLQKTPYQVLVIGDFFGAAKDHEIRLENALKKNRSS
jgi:hypothetical protein